MFGKGYFLEWLMSIAGAKKMKMSFRFKFIMTLSKLCKVALMLFIFGTANILADVCVWRNPERTMSTIFPEAKDYRTVDKKISPDKREIIEKKLNDKLAPGEREDWTYYKILGKDDQGLGCIIADAEKGEFGVIEIVRSEEHTSELQSPTNNVCSLMPE